MFLIGLTGGIATGKSLVSSVFQDNNVPVIDADLIAKQIVEPGKPAYNKIIKSFGEEILKENGEIDRAKLGAIIFTDIEKRRILNRITHPWIYGEMKKQVFKYCWRGEQFVVLDLPLLFETGSVISYLYKTIVVTCDEGIQVERLKLRNSYTEQEAKNRIDAQMPLEKKTNLADIVIENSGTIAGTRKQTEDVIRMLRLSRHHIRNRLLIFALIFVIVSIGLGLIYTIVHTVFKR